MNIDVNHVTRTFGTFRALDDVSLNIREGELVAALLAGPDPAPGRDRRKGLPREARLRAGPTACLTGDRAPRIGPSR